MSDDILERLGKALGGHEFDFDDDVHDVAYSPKKIGPDDCSYTSPGPEPFVCGSCKHMDAYPSPGGSDEGSYCEIVEGPYADGKVDAEDSCRFFEPRKARMILTPIKSESKD